MSNPFYTPSGNPATGAEGLSALMRGEFIAISAAFDLMPRFSTTGLFTTIFNQVGNFTFNLPAAPGTLAMLSDVAAEATARTAADAAEVIARDTAIGVETTRATAAEGANAAAISAETTARAAAVLAEVTARNTAIGVETTRATAAEGANATSALVAAGGIGRNRIHNGGFGINQRGQVSGVALAAAAYGHDRWKAGAAGCTYTFAQAQPTTVITITDGTLQQVIEALTVEGGSYTLSWQGSATARINGGAYGASPITVAGLAANTAITVEFATGTVDRAQLEPGAVASVFVRRSFRYELAECQRFFQTYASFVAQAYTNGAGYAFTATLPTVMRTTPTVTLGTETNTNIISLSVDVVGPALVSFVIMPNNFDFRSVFNFTASADL